MSVYLCGLLCVCILHFKRELDFEDFEGPLEQFLEGMCCHVHQCDVFEDHCII